MEYVETLFEIDYESLAISGLTIVLAFKFIMMTGHWLFVDFLGIETKAMREKREEHELLVATAKELKELHSKHENDIKSQKQHDEKIEEELRKCLDEIKLSVLNNIDTMQEYTTNRISDREQSKEIQRNLLNSIQKLALSGEERDKQIDNIIKSQKESLADRINQKYKYYLSIKGIPEDEVDEFVSLHDAYKGLGGNHTGDAKFDYCMKNLQIIPVDVQLKFE